MNPASSTLSVMIRLVLYFLRSQFAIAALSANLWWRPKTGSRSFSLRGLLNERDWSQEVGGSNRSSSAVQLMRNGFFDF